MMKNAYNFPDDPCSLNVPSSTIILRWLYFLVVVQSLGMNTRMTIRSRRT